MRVLVDTSILIDHLRGHANATKALNEAAARGDELWSVVIVRTEVLAGMRPSEQAATFTLLNALHWLDIDTAIADRAGELARTFMRSHPGVDTSDYLIAAAAERLGADLWTLNVKHFPMFGDLRPPY